MDKSKSAGAPALDNGLTILEMASLSQTGVGFSELLDVLPTSKGTLVRLLRILTGRRFLVKNEQTGRYEIGDQAYMLIKRNSMLDELSRIAHPHLKAVAEQIQCTTQLFHSDGVWVTPLTKHMLPYSVVMDGERCRNKDWTTTPWGMIFYSELFSDKKKMEIDQDNLNFYQKNHYCYSDDQDYGIRKLAIPIKLPHQRHMCALGIAGTFQALADNKLNDKATLMIHEVTKFQEKFNQIILAHTN